MERGVEAREQENVLFVCLFFLCFFDSCCFSWFIIFIFNVGISEDCLSAARNHPVEGRT